LPLLLSLQVYATLGLQVDPLDPCYLFACVGSSTNNETGLLYTNICTDEFVFYNSFLSAGVTSTTSPLSQANDITIFSDLNLAFISDSGVNQVRVEANPPTIMPLPSSPVDTCQYIFPVLTCLNVMPFFSLTCVCVVVVVEIRESSLLLLCAHHLLDESLR
jgi:hypothetical protein